MPRVIVFVFAGRKPNMDLQLPLVQRIVAEHPNVEYDVWNMARLRTDNWYVRSLRGARTTVRNDFYRVRPRWAGYHAIYKHYAQAEFRDCVFVKIDDDVVFLQTDRFADFVAAVQANPGCVVSAFTVNNGASVRLDPALWEWFEGRGKPLLDWHKHGSFAARAHRHFFDNHGEILSRRLEVVDTEDWLSINCVGLDHEVMSFLAHKIGRPSPTWIAGRKWLNTKLGDEGACNMLPRKIVRGFTAAHLMFGPQNCPPPQLDEWRREYGRIGSDYLEGVAA